MRSQAEPGNEELRGVQGRFGVCEFSLPASVTVLVYQPPSFRKIVLRALPRIARLTEKQPGAVQVNVREEQRHRAAGGDLPGFVQVALRAFGAGPLTAETPLPRAGEQTAGEFVLLAGAAEAGHGLFNFPFTLVPRFLPGNALRMRLCLAMCRRGVGVA